MEAKTEQVDPVEWGCARPCDKGGKPALVDGYGTGYFARGRAEGDVKFWTDLGEKAELVSREWRAVPWNE